MGFMRYIRFQFEIIDRDLVSGEIFYLRRITSEKFFLIVIITMKRAKNDQKNCTKRQKIAEKD